MIPQFKSLAKCGLPNYEIDMFGNVRRTDSHKHVNPRFVRAHDNYERGVAYPLSVRTIEGTKYTLRLRRRLVAAAWAPPLYDNECVISIDHSDHWPSLVGILKPDIMQHCSSIQYIFQIHGEQLYAVSKKDMELIESARPLCPTSGWGELKTRLYSSVTTVRGKITECNKQLVVM